MILVKRGLFVGLSAKMEVPYAVSVASNPGSIEWPECESDERIPPSFPSEQPIFEVERHLAEPHGCEPKEAIEIILRIRVDISDSHVVYSQIALLQPYFSGKPPDMSPLASRGGYGNIRIDVELCQRGPQPVAIDKQSSGPGIN